MSIPYFCKTIPFLIVAASLGTSSLLASPSSDEGKGTEPQVVSGIALPFWEDGESQEAFDARIWPEHVLVWLEQENLRDLIADPRTPEMEKQALKRILALQRAWRVSGS